MKAKDLKDRETPALQEELAGLRRKIFELRTQMVTEKVEDTSQFRKHRKNIARVMTELHQRNRSTGVAVASKK